MRKNILITGLPKSGKSTLLKKVISNYEKKVGFVTNEIREGNERIGFVIETYLGEKSVLADINFKTKFKVSRYFVNVKNLNSIIPKVAKFNNEDLLFLDKIGQMELFSKKFRKLTLKYLDSSNICIATLSKVYNEKFIEQIKNRKDVILVEISEENRDLKEKYIKILISKILKAKRYFSEPKRFIPDNDKVIINTDHGIRNLKNIGNNMICDCEFFKENNLCSHIIAFEEYLKINKPIFCKK